MSLATLSSSGSPSLADLVDGLATRTGAWVVVERFGAVVTHGTGAGPCPAALASSLLGKCTSALRAAVVWKRGTATLEGLPVGTAELGDGVTAWFVGAPVEESALVLLAEAAHGDGPVTDPVVEELLHPRGPSRRGRAPRARLVVLNPASAAVARRVVALVAGTEARVHAEADLLLVALPPDAEAEALVARLDDVTVGVADVPEDASDWVATARLAAGAAAAAAALGMPVGRPEDPSIAGELVVSEAMEAVADLVRDLPDAPLRRLQDHDARSGGDLVLSLTAWCRAGFDVPAAAADLHVHTNTLRYRLKRATEVSGLDVTRPRQLLALQLLLGV
jgi:hypothetical protein